MKKQLRGVREVRAIHQATLVLLVLLAVGCVQQYGEKFDVGRAQAIERGKTTKAWVLENFGEPASRMIQAGGEQWHYSYLATKVNPLAAYGLAPMPETKQNDLLIWFDGDVVRDYVLRMSSP